MAMTDSQIQDIAFAILIANGLLCFLYPIGPRGRSSALEFLLKSRSTGMLVPIFLFKVSAPWIAFAFVFLYHGLRIADLRRSAGKEGLPLEVSAKTD